MNLGLFEEMLSVDSTSGQERTFAEFLERRLVEEDNSCRCERFEVGDGTLNLLFTWSGKCEGNLPKLVFCSHLDTVPPYISPVLRRIAAGEVLPDGTMAQRDDTLITGRGSCDAKGQVFSMWSACESLVSQGITDIGLLLLSGEETGSFGAKAFTRDCPGSEWLIVGEPTDNRMVSASKGTKSFQVTMHGVAAHSGYPENGRSAVRMFTDFVSRLDSTAFPEDPVLGPTTWNIGKLHSDNPQNILSPELSFRIYFRTTFASDAMVCELMDSLHTENVDIEAFGGDDPMAYDVLEGYDTTPVAFGSDTPRMTKFTRRSLCGPGSILVAHTPREYVLLSELQKAQSQYVDMAKKICNFARL